MTNIVIPGFNELIPNSTYGKTGEQFNHKDLGVVPATWIMQIAKYQVCNPEQIIDLIQSSAVEYKGKSEEERRKEFSGEAPVWKFMQGFPECEIERIIQGNADSLAHLRNHYDNQSLQTGKYYLQITNGIIPDEIIKGNRDKIAKIGFAAYESMMSHDLANHWLVRLQLPKKDRLPKKRKIESLLNEGVRNSFTFELSEFPGEYSDFASYFRNLYDALAKNGNLYGNLIGATSLGKIEDFSKTFLRSRAAVTMQLTAQCLSKTCQRYQMQQFAQGLGKELGDILGGAVSMGIIQIPIKHEEKPGYKFNPDKPSEN